MGNNAFSALQVLQPLVGGVLIGLASWWLLASIGRVAGVSGIAAAALVPAPADAKSDRYWRLAFIAGLVVGGAITASWLTPPPQSLRPTWLLIPAGLLVGVGTVLGAGCTSGHGVCGLGRRSGRSLAATATFMGVGFATTFLVFSIVGRPLI